MAFLRRGNVRVPVKKNARILLHRLDGAPLWVTINDISHFEEHTLSGSLRNFVTVWVGLSNFVVQESFGKIDGDINGRAVGNVE